MSEPGTGAKLAYSWLPYVVIGFGLCAFLETVLYFRLGGNGLLLLPFIWAYSQYVLVELLVPSAGPQTWVLQLIAWFVLYMALSFGLWVVLGRLSSSIGELAWRRALLGWLAVEVVLGIATVAALYADIVAME